MIFGVSLLVFTIVVLLIIRFFNNQKESRQGWSLRKVGNSFIEYRENNDHESFSLLFKVKYYAKGVPRHAIIIEPKEYEELYTQDYERFNEIMRRLRSALITPEYTFVIKRNDHKSQEYSSVQSIVSSEFDFTVDFKTFTRTIDFTQLEKIEISDWLINEDIPKFNEDGVNFKYDVLEEKMMFKRTVEFVGEEAEVNLKNIKVSKSEYKTWEEEGLIYLEIEAHFESYSNGKLSEFYSGPCTIIYREEQE